MSTFLFNGGFYMKTVPYDNCTITYSINTKDVWESASAKYFLDISGLDEIVIIHNAVSANGGFSNDVVNGLITFCKSMGNKPVVYQFGALTNSEVKELKAKFKASPAEKYQHIRQMKELSAILEYVGFDSITSYSGCDYSESYVYSNGKGKELAYLMMMYSAGALVSSEATNEDDAELAAFCRAFEKDDTRKYRVALALGKSLSNKKTKFKLMDSIRETLQLNKSVGELTNNVKGF